MLILSNQYYNYNMNYYYKDTKIGYLTITEESCAITGILFGKQKQSGDFILTHLINSAFNQIEEYLEGRRKKFEIKINPKGTDFQKMVWNELLKIPYGETRSYKDIAAGVNNPNGSRAVGMANNKNPIPIIIPCHRVIGSNGKLTGYASGVNIKEKLLRIEHS